ncbi:MULTISPECIES: osmoprotectant NAGGN system M42 family peptidase [Gammaproteobacteria]|jgi:peptidase M42 family hydrolase|uniref:Osmoprotectant NAGGN system M42 family peptidase n=1 Tax=Candidatus Macondimonas diazotrophica TaxID=2305248 RepID=A0A4Z0FE18_9GAMM|nr:osmoprotectant NAGGN system M42 family peptidase [Candidatus Macondimonas diazotrophica]TFZ84235.1 osmoprotectant NAGGN system M42 family peptidase [Candidatus Macondimonas diazotrophica]HCO43538.1 osmoprotectant NAGGN system M42 family peptidase [Gammaproteobacteria bacterium]HCZ48616.1 osmoprotectant NAGGN system M42 family peptidase [Gammaproteobacteria bacterium]MCH78054.1 osmoprotectant NAGGN system M42 family peptidase [Gammaproteobacteria bacterium]
MRVLPIDQRYVLDILMKLLHTPSPSGYTDRVVHVVCEELKRLGVPFELTRLGAIRATVRGAARAPARAIVSHLDTLGAQVKALKPNGRLEVVPVGHWNARFAEGARVTLFTDGGSHRGSLLPLKASGHTFGPEVDSQPSAWNNLELRLDEPLGGIEDLMKLGIYVGDFVAVDANPELSDNGFINSRHLDDKAGVAVALGTLKALHDTRPTLPSDVYFLFTILEEVGVGASAVLPDTVAEMVAIDNGTTAPGQNSAEYGATIAMADSSGPFDYHLTRRLLLLCKEFGIAHQRDVFRYYRSDIAAALQAGHDLRTALVCFGIDGSHGWERIHWNALESLIGLLSVYVQSGAMFQREREALGPQDGFPIQPQ